MDELAHDAGRTTIGFPNAKVNLGLRVLRKRPDGFHDIESIFIPIPWRDTLEIESTPNAAYSRISAHGKPIPGSLENNIVLRAHQLLKDTHDIPHVRFHLVKAIPMGAGLGGGSSDGAHALLLLNRLFKLGMNPKELTALAAQLGSDCPFFITNTIAHVTGRGEHVSPLDLSLSGWWMALIHPGVHISTPEAFAWVKPDATRPGLAGWVGTHPGQWTDVLKNDFTEPAANRYPEIGHALKLLREGGAAFADMSGSGSTVFGMFQGPPPPGLFSDCPEGWATWMGPMED